MIKECKIENFTDYEIFKESNEIVEALKLKDPAPALSWCKTNKSKLGSKNAGELIFELKVV